MSYILSYPIQPIFRNKSKIQQETNNFINELSTNVIIKLVYQYIKKNVFKRRQVTYQSIGNIKSFAKFIQLREQIKQVVG